MRDADPFPRAQIRSDLRRIGPKAMIVQVHPIRRAVCLFILPSTISLVWLAL